MIRIRIRMGVIVTQVHFINVNSTNSLIHQSNKVIKAREIG